MRRRGDGHIGTMGAMGAASVPSPDFGTAETDAAAAPARGSVFARTSNTYERARPDPAATAACRFRRRSFVAVPGKDGGDEAMSAAMRQTRPTNERRQPSAQRPGRHGDAR